MYPCLIPKFALNATVNLTIAGQGIDENGEERPDVVFNDVKCNIQFKSIEKLTADKQIITLSGKANFIGDICPDIASIKGGTLEYNGETYDIYAGQKNLNFDGTVNYTSLELM